MKKFLISITIIILINSLLLAEKYSGEFLNLGIGVKAKSLGNAFVARADDATSIYWNSAGMQNINNTRFNIIHCEEFQGVLNYDSFALVHPFNDKSRFGFLLSRIGVSGIPFTTLENPQDSISINNQPEIDSKNNYADYTGYLSFSSKITEKLFWGVSTKIIYKKIKNISASGLGLDIGVFYRPRKIYLSELIFETYLVH